CKVDLAPPEAAEPNKYSCLARFSKLLLCERRSEGHLAPESSGHRCRIRKSRPARMGSPPASPLEPQDSRSVPQTRCPARLYRATSGSLVEPTSGRLPEPRCNSEYKRPPKQQAFRKHELCDQTSCYSSMNGFDTLRRQSSDSAAFVTRSLLSSSKARAFC